jgi:hypothetical protein
VEPEGYRLMMSKIPVFPQEDPTDFDVGVYWKSTGDLVVGKSAGKGLASVARHGGFQRVIARHVVEDRSRSYS